jgi:hypothetical protein
MGAMFVTMALMKNISWSCAPCRYVRNGGELSEAFLRYA